MTFDMESYVDLDLPARRSAGLASFDADAALNLVAEFCVSKKTMSWEGSIWRCSGPRAL